MPLPLPEWNDLSPWRFRALTGALVLSTLAVVTWASARTLQACHEAAVTEDRRAALAEGKRREPDILGEITALGTDHAWAGSYTSAGSAHIVLAPRGGFVVIFSGCWGPWDASYGYVREENGELVFEFE